MIPRPYQVVGRDWLAGKTRALLADEMRVGKTPQAILAAEKLGLHRILVVCPAIAVTQWQQEWIRWAGCSSTVLDRGVWSLNGVMIASYNMATAMKDVLATHHWDLLILDESHYAKNPEAKRAKAMLARGGLAWHADRVWALSGTPAPKHAAEAWVMLCAFGVTAATYQDFVSHFCRVDDTNGRILGTRMDRLDEFRELCAPITLRRMRAEVAPDMPAIGFNPLYVKAKNTDDYVIPANVKDEDLLVWLAEHPVETAVTRAQIAMAKVDPVFDEVSEAITAGELQQTVIFGWHVPPLLELERRFKAAGITVGVIYGATPLAERNRLQAAFKQGTIAVMVAQLIAAGTAIDLSAARHGYFLEVDWVPGNNMQAANRLVNMEKKDPVTFDIVTLPGTVDDRVQRVVARRATEVSQLF